MSVAQQVTKSTTQFDEATDTTYLGKTERGTYVYTTVASDVSR